jgi:imidazolonepropionase-like amidohydrolase
MTAVSVDHLCHNPSPLGDHVRRSIRPRPLAVRLAPALSAVALLVQPHAALAQSSTSAPSAYTSVTDSVVALTHAKLIDGTGAPARDDQTIVIEHGRIAAVGPSATVAVPADAHTIDLSGKMVIPGIVGIHDHMYYGSRFGASRPMAFSYPKLFLATGVTTIRTTGSVDPYTELNLRQSIETGKTVGPEIVATGPYLQGDPSMSGWMHPLSGPEDARRMVRYWGEEGVTWFKAYTRITLAELKAAIDEAHKHGIKVTAHLCSVGYREAIAAGIDNLEHGLLTDTEFWPEKQADVCPLPGDSAQYDGLNIQGPAVQETIHDMVSHHVAMTSTLAVFELHGPSHRPEDPRVLGALAPMISAAVKAWMDSARTKDDTAERIALHKAMAFERAFVQAGGLLGAGSDPCCLSEIAGYGDQRNFELLREAGFSPEETIQIMTLNGARVLGFADRIGSVAVGKQADLVVLDGDITRDPHDITTVNTVFRRGIGYDPVRLTAAVQGQVGMR